ncbi:MAG: TIGR00282 family metallophosphoesterase, partial [Candidatus Omnitrophica bacterium]|nr:TIGR00282 family metallophosphoesterase [Candidatus Omnitrophota bacterium]
KPEIFELINQEERILRPLNFPSGAPGRGASVFKAKNGIKVGVINANGRVFMEALECPFKTVLKAAEELAKETKIIIVDIHAEATSEKIALGWYLDGKVSAILGTHTHIQTADEKILPQGTAYITDVGMTGPYDSVIGRRVEDVLTRFLSSIPVRFEVAEGNVQLHGALVEIDEATGKARSILRIQKKI